MFSDLGLEWPPKYSQYFEDAVGFLNYSPRMMELAWLCSKVADMKGGDSEYARDLNMSIQWGDDNREETPCIICTSVIFLARRLRLLRVFYQRYDVLDDDPSATLTGSQKATVLAIIVM